MGLTKETYTSYDIAKKFIPSLEIRFIENKYEIWIDGKKVFQCQGSDNYINNCLDSIFYGIKLAFKQNSLKHKLSIL